MFERFNRELNSVNTLYANNWGVAWRKQGQDNLMLFRQMAEDAFGKAGFAEVIRKYNIKVLDKLDLDNVGTAERVEVIDLVGILDKKGPRRAIVEALAAVAFYVDENYTEHELRAVFRLAKQEIQHEDPDLLDGNQGICPCVIS